MAACPLRVVVSTGRRNTYPGGERWSVLRGISDFVEVSQRQRRRSCEIAGREGESLKRSDGRLVSRHLPFIAKQPGMGGDLTQVLRRPVELASRKRTFDLGAIHPFKSVAR